MDRLQSLRAFVTVADKGSFIAAACSLRRSAASVTRAIEQVEEDLGVLLLHRTTRTVTLTERGAAYLGRCRQILADIEDADSLARGVDAVPRGALAVAAPLMFGRLHVLPVIATMLREHPRLAVRLVLSDRVVHPAEEGIDVTVRIGELADSALIAVKVGVVRRVCVASRSYLDERGLPESPSDLAAHDLIAFEGLDASQEWRFGAQRKTVQRIDPRLTVSTADAAIAAAEAGLGITRTLSYQVWDAVEAGRLIQVLASWAPPDIPVHVVYPSRRMGSANVAAFVRAARAHFATLPMLANTPRSKG